jgi:hypothetical protein
MRNGTIIGSYDKYYVVLLESKETLLAHKSLNPGSFELLDRVEFSTYLFKGQSCCKGLKLLYRGLDKRAEALFLALASTPEVVEYKLEDLLAAILSGEEIDLEIIGIRNYHGSLRVVCRE